MAEASQYIFPFKELAEMMIKKQNLHEGFWSIYVRFGINATNLSVNNAAHVPTAIVPVLEIGLQMDVEKGPLAVDASVINPAQRATKTKTAIGGLAMGKAKAKSPVNTRLK